MIRTSCVLAGILTLPATVSFAANSVTYTVDPTVSTLTASGSFNGNPITPQSLTPDSLTTSYFGLIQADRDEILDTLLFTGGSITANNSGSYKPPVGSPAAANYGTLTAPNILTQFLGAVRDFAFTPTSPSINIVGDNFDSALVQGTILSGSLNYAVLVNNIQQGSDGSTAITGSLVLTTGVATLVESGGFEILTVPIETDLSVIISDDPLEMHLSGQIVARREINGAPVPEPASLGIMVFGAAALLNRRRRH